MKRFSFLICAVLHYSASVPIGGNFSTDFSSKGLQPVVRLLPDDRAEYVLLVSELGNIIIIDARTKQEMISYFAPELEGNTVAIVGEKFYSIDKVKGTIHSTSLTNVISSPEEGINWIHVGSFRNESNSDRSVVAVDGNTFYFTTFEGNLYKYDTILKTITKSATLIKNTHYNSLIMVEEILFISGFKVGVEKPGNHIAYMFQESSVTAWKFHSQFKYPVLFKLEKKVCFTGGKYLVNGPEEAPGEKNPIQCYDVEKKKWDDPITNSKETRINPGVVTSQYGTFIIGGHKVESVETRKLTNWTKYIEMVLKPQHTLTPTPTPQLTTKPTSTSTFKPTTKPTPTSTSKPTSKPTRTPEPAKVISNNFFDTIEIFNHDTNSFSYIQTPPSMTQNYYSSHSFYFGKN